jgi:hypothetical protein
MPEPNEIKPTEGNLTSNDGTQNPPVEQPTPPAPKVDEDEVERRAQARAKEILDAAREEARLKEAEAQGNYKILFEDSEKARKKAELNAWRLKALNKFNLDDKLYDSLTGDNEDDVMKSAKRLRDAIDAEVKARTSSETGETHESGNLPPARRGNPPNPRKPNADQQTVTALAGALDLGAFRRVERGN